MFWRKWLVRFLVLLIAAGLGGAAFLYLHWTSPSMMRRRVIAKLGEQIPGAAVSLDSARLRLLGGIALRELRLTRHDDPDRNEFAHVPSAILYHDKEQLLDGKLAIRKVMLHRPRITLVRGRDGRWNIDNLFGPAEPGTPIPTMVIQHGTLVLEDRQVTPPLTTEIRDVDLTLLNDPLPEVTCHGTGQADLAGPVHLRASWKRDTGGLALSVDASEVPIKAPLWRALQPYLPPGADCMQQLAGMGKLHADIGYQPNQPLSWSHDVRLELWDGALVHASIPLPLQEVKASLRCLDKEIRIEQLTAVSGPSRIELKGWARCGQRPPPATPTPEGPESLDAFVIDKRTRPAAACPEEGCDGMGCNLSRHLPADIDLDAQLKVTNLALDSKLLAKLPGVIQKVNAEYAPRGPVDLSVSMSRIDGNCKQRCVVEPRDLTASFWMFPYPLEHATGKLELTVDTAAAIEHLSIDMEGRAGSAQVFIHGTVNGDAAGTRVDVKLWGDNLPMDDKLVQALPESEREMARSFRPTGLLDFEAFIHRDDEEVGFENRFLIRFHDAAICFDEFPYPLEDVSATLDVLNDRWKFRDFVGRHRGGEVRAHGQSQADLPDRATLYISGTNILIDDEMRQAVKEPELKNAWATFEPRGRMNFQSRVEIVPDKAPDVDVTLTAIDCSIRPSFFPYQLDQLNGTVRYAQRWLHVQKLQARHGQTKLSVNEAKAYLKPNGGVWVDLAYLRGQPLIIDEPLLAALPPVLDKTCRNLGVKGPVELKTHVTIDSDPRLGEWPIVFWDGELGVNNATFAVGVPLTGVTGKAACRGRYNGQQLEGLVGNLLLDQVTLYNQPFRNIQSQLEVSRSDPDVLVLPGIQAELFGGQIYGPARIEFGSRVRYELNVTASRIQLEKFGNHNLGSSGLLSGLASGQLYLTGQGSDLAALSGRGNIDVPNGRLYNLPVLLDLLKFIGLRLPDRTAFEEAHSDFTIRGARVNINHLDLYGNSISLRGQGSMNLDGTDLNLEFYAVWARILQLLPPIIKEIPPAMSKYLLKVRMRGKVGDVKLSKEPVPIVVEPLKEFLDKLPRRRSERQKVGR